MKLTGRRTGSNVEDRRSQGGRSGRTTGLSLGKIIIVGGGTTEEYVPTARDEQLATFASQILAGTEDVWSLLFAQMGRTYLPM